MFPKGHRDSEENIKASGLSYTFLRPNGFMQNLVNYNAGMISSQNAFFGCQGSGAVSVVDIRDIAAVAVIVLAGHKPITFDQFALDYAFAFREEAKVAS